MRACVPVLILATQVLEHTVIRTTLPSRNSEGFTNSRREDGGHAPGILLRSHIGPEGRTPSCTSTHRPCHRRFGPRRGGDRADAPLRRDGGVVPLARPACRRCANPPTTPPTTPPTPAHHTRVLSPLIADVLFVLVCLTCFFFAFNCTLKESVSCLLWLPVEGKKLKWRYSKIGLFPVSPQCRAWALTTSTCDYTILYICLSAPYHNVPLRHMWRTSKTTKAD